MTERILLTRLISKVEAVRAAQFAYFKHRNNVNLRISKAKEADLDAFLKELRRRGYVGDSEEVTQPGLFGK